MSEKSIFETVIADRTFDEERALYHLTDATVNGCTFAGPADGESALKEARRIAVKNSSFSLRYPLWHVKDFSLENSKMDENTRAALWYCQNGTIRHTVLGGIKALRECRGMTLDGVTAVSDEFGWRSRGLTFTDCDITSSYLLFEASNVTIKDFRLRGKYSFQYTNRVTIENAELDTKDAFWHSRGVTVKNSTVKGEYLGWYSDGLTLIHCHIIGTQPLCYCRHLRLIDCTMEATDLSFEYSDVKATVKGRIESVKNPRSGQIVADEIGEIIEGDAVMKTRCKIITK